MLPSELAQLEGSSVLDAREAVLKGWRKQHALLFPTLTNAYPDLFPKAPFWVSRFVWAMATV